MVAQSGELGTHCTRGNSFGVEQIHSSTRALERQPRWGTKDDDDVDKDVL